MVGFWLSELIGVARMQKRNRGLDSNTKSIDENLRLASEILSQIREEKIDTKARNIEQVRSEIGKLSEKYGVKMPGLTNSVATTFAGVGLCQELSMRFILEYVIKTKCKNISAVIIDNPEDHLQGIPRNGHMLVFIGNVEAPGSVFIARGNSNRYVNLENRHTFIKFLNQNIQAGILVDPLLQFFGRTDQVQPVLAYCKSRSIEHVIGIKTYKFQNFFVEFSGEILKTAQQLACQYQIDSGQHQQSCHNAPTRASDLEVFYKVPLPSSEVRDYFFGLQGVLGGDISRVNQQQSFAFFSQIWYQQLSADARQNLRENLNLTEQSETCNWYRQGPR